MTTTFVPGDGANGVAIQADGKIVLAGMGNQHFALARYNTDGRLDTSFNGTGTVTTTFTGQNLEQANALAIQADGKIVAVGSAFDNVHAVFALARYNADGSLDRGFGTGGLSFGPGGKVMTSFGDQSGDIARSVVIQARREDRRCGRRRCLHTHLPRRACTLHRR